MEGGLAADAVNEQSTKETAYAFGSSRRSGLRSQVPGAKARRSGAAATAEPFDLLARAEDQAAA
ncbi:hypothetical protein JCM17478_34840 [Thermopirellula anaerolimosa]